MLKPQTIAKKIGMSLADWPGRCHEVSDLLLKRGIVKGKLQYGHYCGSVAEGSMFSGRTIIQHGWIKGLKKIIDPTRWVFECKEPYIHTCELTSPDYDFGGNKLKEKQNSISSNKPIICFGLFYNCVNLNLVLSRNS